MTDPLRASIPPDVLIDVDLQPQVLIEMRFSARRTEKGKPFLQPADPMRWRAFEERLAKRSKKGEPYNVIASFIHDTGLRSPGANRVLWKTYRYAMAALREKYSSLTMETGKVHRCPFRNEEALHDAMKYLVLGVDVIMIDGEELTLPATTTLLTREQFWAFYDRVIKWLGEHGIAIPSLEEMFAA